MKINADLNIDVVMGDFSIENTGCQGYLPEGATYQKIVEVFGESQDHVSLDNKITVQWRGRINGLIFSIYDYKSKVDAEQNTDWHIGGKQKFVAELVNLYFKNS